MELDISPGRRVLDSIRDTLDAFDADLVGRGERLECAQLAGGLASRLTALSAVLLAAADAAQESLRQAGTPTTSWLAIQGGLSKREAAGMVHQARDLAAHPQVAQAAAAGQISVGQAKAIGTVLGGLDSLTGDQQAEAARRNRSLVFRRDGNGSILFSGSLPMVDGEAWIAQLDAYTESRRRTALEERDPAGAGLTPPA